LLFPNRIWIDEAWKAFGGGWGKKVGMPRRVYVVVCFRYAWKALLGGSIENGTSLGVKVLGFIIRFLRSSDLKGSTTYRGGL
jgi:hypothetical protein